VEDLPAETPAATTRCAGWVIQFCANTHPPARCFGSAPSSPGSPLNRRADVLNVGYLVDVFVVRDGKKGAKPWIIPELVSKNGQWMFTNFHYEKENLVGVLQQLKKDREQTK